MNENNLVTALNDTVGEQINNELGALKTIRHAFSPKFNKRMSKLVKSADHPASLFLWRHGRLVKAAASIAAAALIFVGSYAAYRRFAPKLQGEEYGYNIITDEKRDLSPITKGTRKYNFVQYGYSEDTMLPFEEESGYSDNTDEYIKLNKQDVCSKVRELCGLAPDDKAASADMLYDNWYLYTNYKDGTLLSYKLTPSNNDLSITVYPDDESYVRDFGDVPGSGLSDNRTVYYRYTRYTADDEVTQTEFELVNDKIGTKKPDTKKPDYEKYNFAFVYRGEHPMTVVMNVNTERNNLAACRRNLVDLIDSIMQ